MVQERDYSQPQLKQLYTEEQIRQRLAELERIKKELTDLWQRTKLEETPVVTKEDIASIVSKMTGIPLEELSEEEKFKLLKLEERIHQRIVNQKEAVKVVCEAIRRSRAGLKDIRRPIGTFIFLGPTGVGKTELSKALAEVLYGSEDPLIRVDMSEYMEKHAVSRLIGAPPGYVGYDEGGQLTEIVRRKPFSVILMDEIEKAHPEVFNILLQIMEDGRLTDGHGRTVDFKNSILIMTSNVGSDLIYRKTLGFDGAEERSEMPSYEELKSKVMDSLKEQFRPEFLNRVDEIVVFKSLDKKEIEKIVDLELKKVEKLLSSQKIKLKATGRTKKWLTEEGYEPRFGARPLKRLIQKEIGNPISDRIIEGKFKEGDTITIDFLKNKLDFRRTRNNNEKDSEK